MSTENPHQVSYDRYLDVTSFSTFDDAGLFKTWYFGGNISGNLNLEMQNINSSRDTLDMLSRYVEFYYVAHRALKFEKIHNKSHSIELKELNIDYHKDIKSLLFHIIDDVYKRAQSNRESTEFKVSKEVWQSMHEKGVLEILQRYKASRELKTNHRTQELTMEKRFELAKARMLAKHMPAKHEVKNEIKPFRRSGLRLK